MNPRAPFHFAPPERRFRVMRTNDSRITRALLRPTDALIWYFRGLRARRAFRRWSTPEAERAYNAGKNTGAMLGIGYCSFIALLLVAGLLLAGHGQ